MRLSRLTDYGILLLTTMAEDAGRTHTARGLAEDTRLPLPTVSKVLKALTRAGLLVSHRGVVGGYGLAREAGAITLLDIVTALEGPVALTQCAEGPGCCSLEGGCGPRPHLQAANRAVVQALEGVRLSALVPQPTLLTLPRRPSP